MRAAWCGTTSEGMVVIDTSVCSCAYPDCGGYNMHEPHCGIEPLGYLPAEAAADPPEHTEWWSGEPDLLPSMLWDFGGVA